MIQRCCSSNESLLDHTGWTMTSLLYSVLFERLIWVVSCFDSRLYSQSALDERNTVARLHRHKGAGSTQGASMLVTGFTDGRNMPVSERAEMFGKLIGIC